MIRQDQLDWLAAQNEEAQARAEVAAAEKIDRLPTAYAPRADGDRAVVPSPLLWGALFAALPRGARPLLKNAQLGQSGHLILHYTGERLGQDDLDVFLALLRLSQDQHQDNNHGAQLGVVVRLSGGAILRMLGVTDTGGSARAEGGAGSRDRLEASLRRLTEAYIELRGVRGEVLMGHLVAGARRGRNGDDWQVTLAYELAPAFYRGLAGVDLRVRRTLRGKPLAQWLHAWLSSHKGEPRQHGLETLRRLSGSAASAPKFRQMLERSLGALNDVLGEVGLGLKWSIRNGVLSCHQKKAADR